jgi:hypothetical protein
MIRQTFRLVITLSTPLGISTIRRMFGGFARVAIALALAEALAGCDVISPWSPTPDDASTHPAASAKPISTGKYIGKTLSDLKQDFGQPTTVQPLAQTAGYMIVYVRPGGTHYVFETGSNGKIVSAATSH